MSSARQSLAERDEPNILRRCSSTHSALRVDLTGDPTFVDLVRQVRETALGAYAHQELPFEKLVEALQPLRKAGQHPLVQAMLVLHNAPTQAGVTGNLEVEPIDLQTDTAKVDLNLSLAETPSGMDGWLEYNTDLFDRATIERIIRRFQTVLEAAVADPRRPVAQLRVIDDAEHERVLVEWNRTAAACGAERGVHELIEAQAAHTPHAIAVSFEDRQLTYAELNARANQLARYLQSLGVGPETIVGVYLERSVEMLVGLLGILKAGGAYLPLDPLFPADRLAYMLADSRAPVLVTQTRLADTLAVGEARVVRLDAEWSRIAELPTTNLALPSDGQRLAYVLYTSGSTGRPKGVQIVQRGLVNFLTTMRQSPGFEASDVLLAVTTLSFDIAGLELFLPLTVGGRVALVSSEVAADGERLLRALQTTGATVMQATPATWRLLIAAGWQATPHLRVLCGGEALSRELAVQLLARAGAVWNLYGPTETTIWSTLHAVHAVDDRSVSIGRPIANTQVYVLDARQQPVPIGVPGELYLGGDGLARGYLNQPELTAAKFVANPFASEPGARMYRTGDVVRYRADGTLEYLERADTQVKLRGYRIELGEIESVLEHHPDVRQAVVVLREDSPGDQRLVAYVVTAGNSQFDATDMRQQLRSHVPEYMVPSALTLLDELPLTPNGKIDRRALPAPMLAAGVRSEGSVAPRDDVERSLVQLWEELLGTRGIGIRDDFFDVGGHSLLAARLVFRIQTTFGRNLPVATLLHSSTIEQLAAVLRAPENREVWDPLVMLQSGLPTRPPMFFVHGAFGDVLCYSDLAQALGPDQPCYVLQAIGLDGVREPLDCVEDMAAEYIQEIRDIQPTGPYCLAGFSIGGTIAFEMARQLVEAGEEVPILGVFDHPFANGAFLTKLSLPVFLSRFAHNLVRNIPHWVRMARDVKRGHWGTVLKERGRLGRRALSRFVATRAPSIDEVLNEVEEVHGLEYLAEWPEYRRRVLEGQFRAMRTYEFHTYAGPLTLFRARRQPLVSAHDPYLGWRDAIQGAIEVVDVPWQPQLPFASGTLRPGPRRQVAHFARRVVVSA